MSNPEMIRDLFRQMEWADAAVWTAVLRSPEACADPGMRERLHHIHLVQRAFLSLWRGEPIDGHAGEDLEPAALAAWAQGYYREAFAELAATDAAAFDRPVDIPWHAGVAKRIGRPPQPPTLAETAVQVFAHTAHHRGQVNLHLRELGGEPPLIDFIMWVWQGNPDAAWP